MVNRTAYGTLVDTVLHSGCCKTGAERIAGHFQADGSICRGSISWLKTWPLDCCPHCREKSDEQIPAGRWRLCSRSTFASNIPKTHRQSIRNIMRSKEAKSHWANRSEKSDRCRDGRGRYRPYQHGAIYYTPQTGAHPVRGPSATGCWGQGRNQERLGYPTDDEIS